MAHTTAYRIVTGNAAQVTEEVGNLLEAHWQLLGDLKVDAGVYSQAMVQEEHYGGVDSNVLVTIEELDGIKYAIESISDAIGNIATGLGGLAMDLSGRHEEASLDSKPTKVKSQPSKRK